LCRRTFLVFGHIVGHAPLADRAGARAVARQVHLVELEIAHDLDVRSNCVRLAAEADDDVGVDCHRWDRGADARDQGAILGARVAALHAFQHRVVAGLNRDFDVRADLGQVAHRLQDAVGHVVGVAGEEADAPEAVDFVDRAQQVGQVMELLIVNC
jgi:hypothetical protein